MKKSVVGFLALLWVLLAINPVCQLIGFLSGMRFTLASEKIFLIGTACVAVLVSASLIKEPVELDGAGALLATLLPVISAANGVYTALASDWNLALVFLLITQAATIVILARTLRRGPARIAAIVVGVAMTILLLFALSFDFLFSAVGKEQAVREVPSPDGSRVARVIVREQDEMSESALYVDVARTEKRDILIGSYSPIPARVYQGAARQQEAIEVAWREDGTLLIDGAPYGPDTPMA